MTVIRRAPWLLVLVAAGTINGCTIVQLREETRDFYAATVLAGRVLPSEWHGPVSVAAVTRRDSKVEFAHEIWLHEPGGFELIVPDGEYTVVAFGDRDNDGVPDTDAPVGRSEKPVHVQREGLITLVDVTLGGAGSDSVTNPMLAGHLRQPLPSTQIGARVKLDDPLFSAEVGQRGYWSPLESFRSTGGNVYFVDEYDADRIPVLFIHGAAGGAQDFRYFVEHLDRTRYQAWVFQYPSGAPLDSISHLLYWKLINLQLRYGFTRLHLVAHSMGGLVARRLLVDHGTQLPQLAQFISISTPWSGEVNATLGVNHSPAVIPSWRDMQPDGPFLKTLFSQPLPPRVGHSLLFGHRGGYNLLRPTSDGTITLASQLRSEAQSGARLVMGFDEDHVSILSAPAVVSQVRRLLEAADGAGERAGGRLRFELRLPDGHAPVGGVPTAVLWPVPTAAGMPGPPLLLAIPWMKDAPEVGPLEAGEYDVQLAIGAFRGIPQRQRIRIDDGDHRVVTFDLQPQGFLLGQVAVQTDPVAHPAGSFARPADAISVDSIVLDGPSGVRSLVPRRASDAALLDAYLDGRDDAVGQLFSFVGLSAGVHVLTIKAHGYEDHVSRHLIEPGKLLPLTPFLMRKAR